MKSLYDAQSCFQLWTQRSILEKENEYFSSFDNAFDKDRLHHINRMKTILKLGKHLNKAI